MEIGPLVKQPVVSVGPEHTLLDVATMMCDHKVGSAIVQTDEGYPAIITERDLLRAISRGADLSQARVEEYMTSTPVTASRHWDVVEAARRMVRGGFRHLIVIGDGMEPPIGILSIRDLVEALIDEREETLAHAAPAEQQVSHSTG